MGFSRNLILGAPQRVDFWYASHVARGCASDLGGSVQHEKHLDICKRLISLLSNLEE
jgi:hypothetical protein